jgi:RNA polymerase sigma-70 factor, ECF subfamily
MTDLRSEKQQAFEEQALVHSDLLFRYGMGLTRNASDADDLLQETYLKAYRFWDTYEQGTNLRAWLLRILKNSFINLYRKESREPAMVEYSDMGVAASARGIDEDANDLHELVFKSLLDDDLSIALSCLPEDYRTVVILCDLEGLTYKEVAEFVDCPIGTVRSRLHRGRELLHSRLEVYGKERGYVRSAQNADENLRHAVNE